MRILVADFAGHPFQVELSRALSGRGHAVRHAYLARLAGPKGALAWTPGDPAGLSFAPLASGRLWRAGLLGRFFTGLRFGRALGREVRAFGPRVVIVSNVPPEALLVAGLGSRPPTWIWWVQDLLGPGARRVLARRSRCLANWVGSVFERLEARVARKADSIVVISDAFVEYIDASSRPKVTVIPNWAPLDEIAVSNKVNTWSTMFGLNDTFNFVYTGTIGWKHNPDLLIQLTTAVRSRSDVRVVVVSEGPGAEYLRRRANELHLEHIVVLPFQKYSVLSDVMGSADVLIALLERDAGVFSVPSKILSYLCAGRPILGCMPADNLASKVVVKAGAGIIVSPEDESQFIAEAESFLRGDPARLRAMGESGRMFAEENFGIDEIAEQFLGIIRCCEGSGAPVEFGLEAREKPLG